MPSAVAYKNGISLSSVTPTGDAGQMIQQNFQHIADQTPVRQGNWNSSTAYNVGDTVLWTDENYYLCIEENTDVDPTHTGQWLELEAYLPITGATMDGNINLNGNSLTSFLTLTGTSGSSGYQTDTFSFEQWVSGPTLTYPPQVGNTLEMSYNTGESAAATIQSGSYQIVSGEGEDGSELNYIVTGQTFEAIGNPLSEAVTTITVSYPWEVSSSISTGTLSVSGFTSLDSGSITTNGTGTLTVDGGLQIFASSSFDTGTITTNGSGDMAFDGGQLQFSFEGNVEASIQYDGNGGLQINDSFGNSYDFTNGINTSGQSIQVGSVTANAGAFSDGGEVSGSIIAAGGFYGNGANLTSLSAANLTGTLPAISGANLTNLNGTNVTSGTIADARLSANIPKLNWAYLNAFTYFVTAGHFGGNTVSNAIGVVAGTGAGTSPTITLAANSTDVGGQISVHVGTSPAASNATLVTINWNFGYNTVGPFWILEPANANAAALSGATQVYVTGTGNSAQIVVGSTALTAATTYIWNYVVVGH
jgi:hypothetical protein